MKQATHAMDAVHKSHRQMSCQLKTNYTNDRKLIIASTPQNSCNYDQIHILKRIKTYKINLKWYGKKKFKNYAETLLKLDQP